VWFKPLICLAIPKLLINIDKAFVISRIFVLILHFSQILTKFPVGICFVIYVVALAENLDVS